MLWLSVLSAVAEILVISLIFQTTMFFAHTFQPALIGISPCSPWITRLVVIHEFSKTTRKVCMKYNLFHFGARLWLTCPKGSKLQTACSQLHIITPSNNIVITMSSTFPCVIPVGRFPLTNSAIKICLYLVMTDTWTLGTEYLSSRYHMVLQANEA